MEDEQNPLPLSEYQEMRSGILESQGGNSIAYKSFGLIFWSIFWAIFLPFFIQNFYFEAVYTGILLNLLRDFLGHFFTLLYLECLS